ncbi:hypothetical protein DIPPA_19076 [Diplonema papillatum]|nr:hypothetical protein DIPPA_19076 [Diplonema papillatum]
MNTSFSRESRLSRQGYGESVKLVRVPSPRGTVVVRDGSCGVQGHTHAAVGVRFEDESRVSLSKGALSNTFTNSSTEAMHPPTRFDRFNEYDVARRVDEAAWEAKARVQANSLAALSAENIAKQATIDELRAQVATLRADMTTSRQQLVDESMRKELQALHGELEEKRKAVESLEFATDASRTIAALSEQKAGLQRHAAELQRENAKLAEQAKHLSRQVETLIDEQRAATRDRESLDDRVEGLRSDLRKAHATVAAAQAELSNSQRVNAEMNAHVEQSHELLCRARDDNAKLELRLSEIERERVAAREALDEFKNGTNARMQADIAKLVASFEKERTRLRAKVKKERDATSELRAKIGERDTALQQHLETSHAASEMQKLREEDLVISASAEQEAMAARLAQAEADLYTTKAALAEAKTAGVLAYLAERGNLEKDLSAKITIIEEEIRSSVRIVRRVLEKYASHVDPPPSEQDCKVVTLKQLLLLLQSHLSTVIEDPPTTAPCILAWEQRGQDILERAEKIKAELDKSDQTESKSRGQFVSSITSHTVSTTVSE